MALRGKVDYDVFSPLSGDNSMEVDSQTGSSFIANDGLSPLPQNLRNGSTMFKPIPCPLEIAPTTTATLNKLPGSSNNSHKRNFMLRQNSSGSKFGLNNGTVFSPASESDNDFSNVATSRPSSAMSITPTTLSSHVTPNNYVNVKRSGGSVSSLSSADKKPPLPFLSSSKRQANVGDGDYYGKFGNGLNNLVSTVGAGYLKSSAMNSKATQTDMTDLTPSSSSKPNQSNGETQNIQANFIRGVVEDCLDDFEQKWRENCYSFYAKMLYQLMESERRLENTIGMERLDFTRRLTEENERLRLENEHLKAMQFGKFLGPSSK